MPIKKIDARLRARFKEVARDIILRDRNAKKLGRSQNTIGEIERALVQAFALGRELGDTPYTAPRHDHLGIEWEEVSPRGRDVLAGLTYRLGGYDITNPIGLRRVAGDGRLRWASQYDDGRVSARTVAAGSVNPLLRAGLLAVAEGNAELLVLTAKGRVTAEAYWRRREENDPSLPKESLRV